VTTGPPRASGAATRLPPLAPDDARFYAAARLRAARMQPYLASAVFSLVPVASPGLGTFGVDRQWRVYVDMGCARGWGVETTAAVLLHEAHHVLRDHAARATRAGVTPKTHHLWNLAGDAAINDDLLADGVRLPDPVLPRSLGLPARGFEETYYRQLCREAHPAAAMCGSGSGGAPLPVEIGETADGVDGSGLDDIDGDAIRRGVAHDIAAAVADGVTVSPRLVRWAEELLVPEVPWRTLLRAALGRELRGVTGRAHPSWQRPDRRADCRPDVLTPGTIRRTARVAVVADTSASMNQCLLDAVVTEIDALLHQSGVGQTTVVVCDNHATPPQRVRRIAELDLSGGGGTDMRIGIAAAAALRPRPEIVAVLTDGLTPWPDKAPPGVSLVAVLIGSGAPLPSCPQITAIRVHERR
jgi:predicted metal-dependent peptidase